MFEYSHIFPSVGQAIALCNLPSGHMLQKSNVTSCTRWTDWKVYQSVDWCSEWLRLPFHDLLLLYNTLWSYSWFCNLMKSSEATNKSKAVQHFFIVLVLIHACHTMFTFYVMLGQSQYSVLISIPGSPDTPKKALFWSLGCQISHKWNFDVDR